MSNGLQTSAHDWQNFYTGHLTADLTSGGLDVFIDTIPTGTEGCLIIDPDTPANSEAIFYTSKTASKVTCPANGRGYDSSTAIAHNTGTKVIMAPIADDFRYIRTLATATATYIAAGGAFDFVVSPGCVWTGDALGSTLNASMTSGTVYIAGSPVTVATITAHNFTASKDTYVDVSNTGVITYTAVANNAASPALAASNIRLAIIVSGLTSIAAATSINQGQETMVLPIASSIPYAVTDSLGNLICPRDPNRKVLGYRQIIANVTNTTPVAAATGLTVPVIVPSGRKIKVSLGGGANFSISTNNTPVISIWDTSVSGTQLTQTNGTPLSTTTTPFVAEAITTPSATSKTYVAGILASGGGTITVNVGSTFPAFIKVELA